MSHTDIPIIRWVERLLFDAVQKKASDIHIEPTASTCRIRYRVDGWLHDAPTSPPFELATKIAARLKIIAHLDIAEKRLPQEGRFHLLSHPTIEYRISTCPTPYGEKMVIRLQDTNTIQFDLQALGMDAAQQDIFLQAIHQPQGLILVTGPTGSGKSLTLYHALHLLNQPQVNICSIEDPIEMHLPGITQVAVNPKIGLTFAQALRAFLRQDPDIIMIGEIRDLETAEIAITAAQTGHLVLATLHTNNTTETIHRLKHMGVQDDLLNSVLTLILAQRLVRKRCDRCQAPNIGCDACYQGYKGRIGVFECLRMPDLAPTKTLYQAGLEQVKRGMTTLDELKRVVVA